MASYFIRRVLEQHWDVVEPMSTRADWVSYHYYVGLLKISEDKASRLKQASRLFEVGFFRWTSSSRLLVQLLVFDGERLYIDPRFRHEHDKKITAYRVSTG